MSNFAALSNIFVKRYRLRFGVFHLFRHKFVYCLYCGRALACKAASRFWFLSNLWNTTIYFTVFCESGINKTFTIKIHSLKICLKQSTLLFTDLQQFKNSYLHLIYKAMWITCINTKDSQVEIIHVFCKLSSAWICQNVIHRGNEFRNKMEDLFKTDQLVELDKTVLGEGQESSFVFMEVAAASAPQAALDPGGFFRS